MYPQEFVDENGWLGYYCSYQSPTIPDYEDNDGYYGWNCFDQTGPCNGSEAIPNSQDPLSIEVWYTDLGAFYLTPIAGTGDIWVATLLLWEPEVSADEWYGLFVKVYSTDTTKKVTFYAGDGTGQVEPWPFLIFSPECAGISGEGGWHIRSVVVDWEMAVEYTPATIDPPAESLLPQQFSFSEIHPNPFNSITTIQFSIPRSAAVSFTVYDILGKQVDTIFEEHLDAGNHQIQWNADNIPTGMYFITMSSGELRQTRKVIVLK